MKGFKLTLPVRVKYIAFTSDMSRSLIRSNLENHTFYVDAMGNLLNPRALIISGDWADNRLANSLPMNYTITDRAN